MAEEADRLASIVSYGRDKTRLREQAASWRAKAVKLEAQVAPAEAEHASFGVFGWFARRRA